MKAIETVYNGHRFRSRIEAKWAVFFDILNIEWEYEKEGYDLGEYGWYLPDFYLHEVSKWIEIKGGWPSRADMRKCIAFDELVRKERNECLVILTKIPKKVSSKPLEPFELCYSELPSGGMMFDEDVIERYGYGAVSWIKAIWVPHTVKNGDQLLNAFDAARQARFEHGQVGAPRNWGR